MKNQKTLFLLLFLLVCSSLSAFSQVPRFSKFDIKDTGAAIYMPSEPEIEVSYSEDNSIVYSAMVEHDNVGYSFIVVQLAETMEDNPEVWEGVLLAYMEFLNTEVFELTGIVDPGLGHTLDSHPRARGVIQYGEDADGIQYSFKGWADEKMLAVLYVMSEGEVNFNFQQLFLNGFRFPVE